MPFEDDSPLSSTRVCTLSAIERRYTRATELAIVMHDSITFEALCDLYDLIEAVKKGLTLCRECDRMVDEEHSHDTSVEEVGASGE